MRYTFLRVIIFLLCDCCIGYAQVSEWTDVITNGSMTQQLVVQGEDIFLCVDSGNAIEVIPGEDYKLTVYKIKLSGEGNLDFLPVESFTLFTSADSSYATLSMDYIQPTNEWLVVQTFILSPDRLRFRFLLYDDAFNIESKRYLDTVGSVNTAFYVSSFNDHTYLLGSKLPPQDRLAFMDYDHKNKGHLPAVKLGQTNPLQSTWITSMFIDPRTSNMIAYYYNGIQELDTNFNQIHNWLWLDINTHLHGQVIPLGSNYFSHGSYRFGTEGFKLNLVQKYDTLFQIIASDTLGDRSHDNYPFVFNSMDSYHNEILVGGHLDGPFSHFYIFESIKKFYLAKYDDQLNRLWYREYGGDRAYWMNGVKILPDESCMAYGFVTDTVDGFRHAYVMHVGKNGDIISSTELGPDENDNVHIIYDGIGNAMLSNPNNLEIQLVIYDQRGVKVFNKMIYDDNTTLDLTSLPTACYYYNAISKGRLLSSGKLLKVD